MLNARGFAVGVVVCGASAACVGPLRDRVSYESNVDFQPATQTELPPSAESQPAERVSTPVPAVATSAAPAMSLPPPMAAQAAPAGSVSIALPMAGATSSVAPASTATGQAGAGGMPNVQPSTAPAPATPATTNPMTLPDGVVVYRIPDGTGNKDWNPQDKPIQVARGGTLRLIDDDKSVASGHWLHTFGQPCPHATRAIGDGFDCKISNNAPLGVVGGTFEHNIANAGGRLFIEVIAAPAR